MNWLSCCTLVGLLLLQLKCNALNRTIVVKASKAVKPPLDLPVYLNSCPGFWACGMSVAWVMGHITATFISSCNKIPPKGWLGSAFETGLIRTWSKISTPWYQKEQPAQVIGIPPGFHPLEIFGQIKLGRDPGICWRNCILSGKGMPGDSSRWRNWRTLPRREPYRESSA